MPIFILEFKVTYIERVADNERMESYQQFHNRDRHLSVTVVSLSDAI